MRYPIFLLLLLLSACSSPLAVTDNETQILRDAGFASLGWRTGKPERTWTQYIHANDKLYYIVVTIGGSDYRKYGAFVAQARDEIGIRRIASTHGTANGFGSLYETVDWIHRQIDGDGQKE